jgi:hypothetical protein
VQLSLEEVKEEKIKNLWKKRADILPVKAQLLKSGWSYGFISDVFEIPDFKIRIAKNESHSLSLATDLITGKVPLAIMQPENDNYNPRMTPGFKALMDTAIKKLKPLIKEESTGGRIIYFENKDEEYVGDCCENDGCIEKTREQLPESCEAVYVVDNGDTDEIKRCPICSTPYNDFLTWAAEIMKYDNWTAFELFVIFQSMPTMDYQVQNNLHGALVEREKFFQRVGKLARGVSVGWGR